MKQVTVAVGGKTIDVNKEVAHTLEEIERELGTHDQTTAEMTHDICQRTTAPQAKKRPIGFGVPGGETEQQPKSYEL